MRQISRRALGIVVFGSFVAACGGAEPVEGTPQPGADVRSPASTVAASSLRLSAAAISAGETVTTTVTLSGTAQSASGGVVVYLSFPAGVLAGPRFVRILNGRSSASFTLWSNPFLASATTATVTANTASPDPSVFLSQSISVAPPATPPAGSAPHLASVAVDPATVTTGASASGTVTLDAPAPAPLGAAVQVALSNDFFGADADVPAVVVVPPGATSASFAVLTHLAAGASSAQETIVASFFGGAFQGAAWTITAAATTGGSTGTATGAAACAPGQAAVSITVTGGAGSVSSNPSGLAASAGTTATACFTSGTRVELSATHAATWSGVACDGGNSGQDRCRFTTGSAAIGVTATLP